MSSPPFLPRAALLSALTGLPLSFAAAQANIPTAPGTVVSSSFTLDYAIGSVGRTNVPSAPIDFVVDRKVDLSLTAVAPLGTALSGEVLTALYEVTNTGNDTQAYSMDLIDDDPGFANPATGLVLLAVMMDANGNGTPDDSLTPLTAHAATEATASVADGTLTADLGPGETLWVEATMIVPASFPTGSDYDFALQVLAREPSAWRVETTASEGDLMVSDGDALNELGGAAEILFADGALDTAPATGTLDVAGDAALTLVQTLSIISDPVSLIKSVKVVTDDPAADCKTASTVMGGLSVAGACIEYEVLVRNLGLEDMDNIAVKDTLPDGLVFQSAAATGFVAATGASDPILTAPPSATPCDGTPATCEIVLEEARIGQFNDGRLIIRANID